MFETASSKSADGTVYVNTDLLRQKYGEDNVPYLAEFINAVHRGYLVVSDENGLEYRVSFEEWSKCLDSEVMGLIPGYSIYSALKNNSLQELVESQAWDVLADTLVATIKTVYHGALPVSLAVDLAIMAGKCYFG